MDTTQTTGAEEHEPRTWEEFEAEVRKNDPEHAHTLEWFEHPDEWDRMCYCSTCLSYAAEG